LNTPPLDDYSEKARAALLASHPDWQPYMSAYPDKETDTSYVLVTIPSPVDPKRALHFYTADEEITVSFDMYECHFNVLTNPKGGELNTAIEFAERLMREDLLVASFWKQNEWTGSTTVESNEQVAIPDSFDRNSDLLKVRSWTGRLDREHAL
jgi:hypothetical protein